MVYRLARSLARLQNDERRNRSDTHSMENITDDTTGHFDSSGRWYYIIQRQRSTPVLMLSDQHNYCEVYGTAEVVDLVNTIRGVLI